MATKRYVVLIMLALFLSGCISPVTSDTMDASPFLRLNDLTGAPVSTLDGEPLGRVVGLFLDTETGAVQYVVVSLRDDQRGKLMFTGVKQLAPVPWKFFSPPTEDQALTLCVEAEHTVWNAPAFQSMPDPTVPGWDAAVRAYWAEQTPQTP